MAVRDGRARRGPGDQEQLAGPQPSARPVRLLLQPRGALPRGHARGARGDGLMTRGERAATLLSPGSMHLDRPITPILAIYLVIVTVIVGFDARLISDQRGSAVIINVAGRQRGLAERYEKDVILATQGVQSDPGDDEGQLLENADALLHGGDVLAVQGADDDVHIRPAGTDPLIVNRVAEVRRLITE